MKRNGKIEFLRFLMSVAVLLLHTSVMNGGVRIILPHGALAVEFFFLLSGYFMASRCCKLSTTGPDRLGEETLGYVWHKLSAILPELAAAASLNLVLNCVAASPTGLKTYAKMAVGAVAELFQLRMVGLNVYANNGVTWYISAMLIAMLLLYPICRKYYDMFVNVISALIGWLIVGMLYVNGGTQLGPNTVIAGCMYRGLPRGIAEIALGAFVFGLANRLKNVRFTRFASACLSALEAALYAAVIALMQLGKSKYDLLALFLLTIAVTLSFGKQNSFDRLFDNKLCYTLGKLSLPIYLGHRAWLEIFNRFCGSWSYGKKLLIFLLVAMPVSVSLIIIMSKWIRKLTDRIKGVIVEKESEETVSTTT